MLLIEEQIYQEMANHQDEHEVQEQYPLKPKASRKRKRKEEK